MSMGQSLSVSLVQRTEMSTQLTILQRQTMVMTLAMSLRLELIGILHGGADGGNYTPMGECPNPSCRRSLTALEIIRGFNNDPNDFSTQCTGCNRRFDPKLVWKTGSARIEVPFFCDTQTLTRLSGLESMSPQEFERAEPTLFHSARIHNGSIKTAFARLGITYNFDEMTNPTEKIKPFLGRLFDTTIAEISGLSVETIRRLRKKDGIKACTQRTMLAEINATAANN